MKKTKTVHCPDVLGHICEELDTRLTSAQCREIKRHLAHCPNCTAYLDSLKKTIKLYASYPDARVPQKARKKLFAVLKLKG
jgi:anti-sigma factor RsiW